MAKLSGEEIKSPSEKDLNDHAIISSLAFQKSQETLQDLRSEKLSLVDSIPEVMVMKEMEDPRKTFILRRGHYNAPTMEVTPEMPENILPFSADLPPNRLGLAKWIFDG